MRPRRQVKKWQHDPSWLYRRSLRYRRFVIWLYYVYYGYDISFNNLLRYLCECDCWLTEWIAFVLYALRIWVPLALFTLFAMLTMSVPAWPSLFNYVLDYFGLTTY